MSEVRAEYAAAFTRALAGRSCQQVATAAGVSRRTVELNRAGKASGRDVLLKLARAMGVEPNQLLEPAGYAPYSPTVKAKAVAAPVQWETLPEVLTALQVAEILCLCEQTVRDAAKARELPCLRIGTRYLFPKEQLRRLLGYVDSPGAQSSVRGPRRRTRSARPGLVVVPGGQPERRQARSVGI